MNPVFGQYGCQEEGKGHNLSSVEMSLANIIAHSWMTK